MKKIFSWILLNLKKAEKFHLRPFQPDTTFLKNQSRNSNASYFTNISYTKSSTPNNNRIRKVDFNQDNCKKSDYINQNKRYNINTYNNDNRKINSYNYYKDDFQYSNRNFKENNNNNDRNFTNNKNDFETRNYIDIYNNNQYYNKNQKLIVIMICVSSSSTENESIDILPSKSALPSILEIDTNNEFNIYKVSERVFQVGVVNEGQTLKMSIINILNKGFKFIPNFNLNNINLFNSIIDNLKTKVFHLINNFF